MRDGAMSTYAYPFSSEEVVAANREWGANCGPTALAFACQLPLGKVRHAIPGFEGKGYTAPTMMQAALRTLGRTWRDGKDADGKITRNQMCRPRIAIVRVQFTGPWTQPGANVKWAYRQTHWIACWREQETNLVFDCNAGVVTSKQWQEETVPRIVASMPRADGGWLPTHVWRLDDAKA